MNWEGVDDGAVPTIQMDWEGVDDDAVPTILSFLSFDDLLKLRLVSATFREYADDTIICRLREACVKVGMQRLYPDVHQDVELYRDLIHGHDKSSVLYQNLSYEFTPPPAVPTITSESFEQNQARAVRSFFDAATVSKRHADLVWQFGRNFNSTPVPLITPLLSNISVDLEHISLTYQPFLFNPFTFTGLCVLKFESVDSCALVGGGGKYEE